MKALDAWKKIEIRNPEEAIAAIFEKYSANDPRCSTKLSIVINTTINSLITSHIDMPSYGKNNMHIIIYRIIRTKTFCYIKKKIETK